MTWKMLRGCAVLLWLMSVAMLVTSVLAKVYELAYVAPLLLVAPTAVAGYLFWRLANTQRELVIEVITALREHGVSEKLAEGLTTGVLAEDQFNELCKWVQDEVAKQPADWE